MVEQNGEQNVGTKSGNKIRSSWNQIREQKSRTKSWNKIYFVLVSVLNLLTNSFLKFRSARVCLSRTKFDFVLVSVLNLLTISFQNFVPLPPKFRSGFRSGFCSGFCFFRSGIRSGFRFGFRSGCRSGVSSQSAPKRSKPVRTHKINRVSYQKDPINVS